MRCTYKLAGNEPLSVPDPGDVYQFAVGGDHFAGKVIAVQRLTAGRASIELEMNAADWSRYLAAVNR